MATVPIRAWFGGCCWTCLAVQGSVQSQGTCSSRGLHTSPYYSQNTSVSSPMLVLAAQSDTTPNVLGMDQGAAAVGYQARKSPHPFQ